MNPISLKLKETLFRIAVISPILFGLVATGQAQPRLPEGPNRALVELVCGACHDIEMVRINGRSEAGWNNTIDEMTGYGLRLAPADRALVLEYLKTYLPPR